MTVNAKDAPVGWREILTSHHASPLLLVSLGVWLHAAEGLIVATMLPSIVADIGGKPLVAWSSALYELGSIVAGASSGLLALKVGVRRPMAVAAVVFATGCLVSAVATTMPVLLTGRLLQGLGGGGLTAMSFIAVAVLFPSRLSARVMAVMSVLWGASAFLGPLIGGLFVAYSTWRWGFAFFGAQALGLAIWVSFGIRISERSGRTAPDHGIPGLRLLLLAGGVLCVAFSGIEVTRVLTPLSLTVGLVLLLVFLHVDASNPANRLLPRNPFSLRFPLGAGLLMSLTMNIATMGLVTYGPLLMTALHGTSALTAGYVVAAISIGWSLAAIVVSGAPERLDGRNIAIGMVLVACSLVGLIHAMSNGPVWLIALFAFMEGIGYGTAWTFVIRRARRLAPADDVERLSGALPTIGRLGYALGASICGILANGAGYATAESSDDLAFVAQVLFIGSLPLALIALLAMTRFVSDRRQQREATG